MPEPMLTLCRLMASLGHNELKVMCYVFHITQIPHVIFLSICYLFADYHMKYFLMPLGISFPVSFNYL